MSNKNKTTIKIILVILLGLALLATLISCCVVGTKRGFKNSVAFATEGSSDTYKCIPINTEVFNGATFYGFNIDDPSFISANNGSFVVSYNNLIFLLYMSNTDENGTVYQFRRDFFLSECNFKIDSNGFSFDVPFKEYPLPFNDIWANSLKLNRKSDNSIIDLNISSIQTYYSDSGNNSYMEWSVSADNKLVQAQSNPIFTTYYDGLSFRFNFTFYGSTLYSIDFTSDIYNNQETNYFYQLKNNTNNILDNISCIIDLQIMDKTYINMAGFTLSNFDFYILPQEMDYSNISSINLKEKIIIVDNVSKPLDIVYYNKLSNGGWDTVANDYNTLEGFSWSGDWLDSGGSVIFTAKSIQDFIYHSIINRDGETTNDYPFYYKDNKKFQLVYCPPDLAFSIAYNFASTQNYGLAYQKGYREGFATAQSEGTIVGETTSFLKNTFTNLGSLLDVKIFGNVTLGTIIGIPLILMVVLAVLKLVRG